MTATALDACLCVLLVSAAAVTVVGVPERSPPRDRADNVAESLAATVELEYVLAPVEPRAEASPGREAVDRTGNPALRRRTRGSLVSLLGRAAVRTVRFEGDPVTRTAADFAAAVRNATRSSLPVRSQVVVRWRPYPGSHLRRRFVVGPTPPPDADVNAATVRVPSGFDGPPNAARVARQRGFDGLSRAVADRLVRGLFPPEQARFALAGDPPTSSLMRRRYRRAAALYGTSVSEPLSTGDVGAANERLAAAAAPRVEADLRASFDSPGEAAASLELGGVRVVVRTWSA